MTSTNVFAPLNINRAFLPYMRERKTGTIVWIGSVGGYRYMKLSPPYAQQQLTMYLQRYTR